MEELTPTDIAQRRFATAFRGYDTAEVRAFLNRVSQHVALVNDRYGDLLARAGAPASTGGSSGALSGAVRIGPTTSVPAVGTGAGDVVVLRSGTRPDTGPALITLPEGTLTDVPTGPDMGSAVGSDDALAESSSADRDELRRAGLSTHDDVLAAARREGATLVEAAHREAVEVVTRANEEAARIILRARAESRGSSRELRTGDDSVSVEAARAEARAMIEEARALRERVLTDLAKRRRTAHVQLEQLRGAREKLSESLRDARRLVDDAHRNLSTADAEARLAGDAAARRLASEPLATVAELDAEVSATRHLLRGGVLPFPTGRADAPVPSDDDETSPSFDAAASTDLGGDGAPTLRAEGDGHSDPTATEVGAVGAVGVDVEHGSKPADDTPGPSVAVPSMDALFARLRAESGPDTETGAEAAVAVPTPAVAGDADPSSITPDTPHAETPGGTAPDTAAPMKPIEPADADAAASAMADTAEPATDTATGEAAARASADAQTPQVETPDASAASPGAPAAAASPGAHDATSAPDAGTAARVDATFASWDRVVSARGPDAARSLKRAMQDELSTILSSLRSVSGRPDADVVLGSAAVRMELFGDAVRPAVAAGWAAGRISVLADAPSEQGEHPVVTRLVDDAARWLVDELTAPVEAALATIDDAETEHGKLAELIGVHYRSWRVDRAGGIAEGLMHRAFCEATIESVGAGVKLRWIGRADVAPCAPDCEDNRLCDGVAAGDPFPSGHRTPPAADACRNCLLVAVR